MWTVFQALNTGQQTCAVQQTQSQIADRAWAIAMEYFAGKTVTVEYKF